MSARVGLCAVVAALFVTTLAWCDAKATLYDGAPDKVKLAPWGSGNATPSNQVTFLAKPSIEVETRGYYEGARIDLQRPIELGPFVKKPSGSYLVAVVQMGRARGRGRGSGEGGGRRWRGGEQQPGMGPMGPMMPGGQGMPGPMGPMLPGGQGMPGPMGPMGQGGMGPMMPGGQGIPGPMGPMMPGGQGMPGPMGPMGQGGMGPMMPGGQGMPGPMGPMMPGGLDMGQGAPGFGFGPGAGGQPSIERIRVVLVTDKGLIDCGAHKIDPTAVEAEDWLRIVIPVEQFTGPGKTADAQVKQVAFFGDAPGRFYVGRAWLVQEDTPLVADPGPRRRRVTVGQEVRFEAAPQKGDVKARYTWDFDDLDGIQEDAMGPSATWKFDQPGYYVVTLTVKDAAGILTPKVAHVNVLVE
ncbi:MAG: PKD domain-containing protein [Armatimonadetes bacterium]|nr:PKD domain-containing protein [Armatimonadota bacterium]